MKHDLYDQHFEPATAFEAEGARVALAMNLDQIIDRIEDYIGGNVEGVTNIDRMGLTVFLRAELNAVRNAALNDAVNECFAVDNTGDYVCHNRDDCANAIDALKEPQP